MGSEMLWPIFAQLQQGQELHISRPGFFSLSSKVSIRSLASRSSFRSGTPSLDMQKSKNPPNIYDYYSVSVWKKNQQTLG